MHIFLIAILLLILNFIEFSPDSFDLGTLDEDFSATLFMEPDIIIYDKETPAEEIAAEPFTPEEIEGIQIILEKESLLKDEDLILADYFSDNGTFEATWRWVDDNAHNLKSKDEYIVLKIMDEFNPDNYSLLVNNTIMAFYKTKNDMHYYTLNQGIERINEIAVKEIIKKPQFGINFLEPSVDAIYLIEDQPKPITIETISLKRYFSKLDKYLIINNWDAHTLNTEFDLKGGIPSINNGHLQIMPKNINLAFQYTGTIEAINISALNIMGTNFTLTAFILFSLIGSSLFLCSRVDSLKSLFQQFKSAFNQKARYFHADKEVQNITPLRIISVTLFFILIFVFILPLEQSFFKSVLIATAVLLSLVLVAIVAKGFWRQSK